MSAIKMGRPVAEIVSAYGDPADFAERELRMLADIQSMPIGTKLYAVPVFDSGGDDRSPRRPSTHSAPSYAGYLRRHACRLDQPKRGAIENAATVIELLVQETRRLHQELIDSQEKTHD